VNALIQLTVQWINLHPQLAGFAVILIALSESLALIGLIVPGTIVMFAVGALVANGALSVWTTLACAVFGAILGDGLSYWLGRHYHERLRAFWPFSRYPALLARGETFFIRHGGTSVLLGRFVGPVRPVIPVVAGMLGMRPGRFFLVNVLSALGWAPAYLLPGMAFGASLALASQVAGRLGVFLGLLLLIGWLSFALSRRAYRFVQPRGATWANAVLKWARRHPAGGRVVDELLDSTGSGARSLGLLAALLLGGGWLFLGVLEDLLSGDPLVRADQAVYQLLQALRSPWGDRLMVAWTELGDPTVLLAVLAAGLAWLAWRRQWVAALYWLASTIFGAVAVTLIKFVVQRPRPVPLYQGAESFAFPSGHATLSIVVYGFLAVLVVHGLRGGRRWLPLALVGLLVAGIGASRLYLGAHWLSDVAGGYGLGLAALGLLGIAYVRRAPRPLDSRGLAFATLAAFILAGGWHITRRAAYDLARYGQRPAVRMLAANAWWREDWRTLPAWRTTLGGEREEALNVQIAGDPAILRGILTAHGWVVPVTLSPATALRWLLPDVPLEELPVLPHLNDGRREVLRLVLHDPKGDPAGGQLVLRVWPSNTVLAPGRTPIWIGSVARQRLMALPLLRFPRTVRQAAGATRRLRQISDPRLSMRRAVRAVAHGARAPIAVLLLRINGAGAAPALRSDRLRRRG